MGRVPNMEDWPAWIPLVIALVLMTCTLWGPLLWGGGPLRSIVLTALIYLAGVFLVFGIDWRKP